MEKYAVDYKLRVLEGDVALTGGRLARAFENNIGFLKGFDIDRMLYWYRVHAGKRARGVPYAADAGHFENNLKGQTAGEFLMGAGATLAYREDKDLRDTARALIAEIDACRDADGFVIPIDKSEFPTREYPNYTRAWITFGLLDAGRAGEGRAYELARDMGDWFNRCSVLPYVKDLNLGFQGILANTRLYDSPVGVARDVEVAERHYVETWWLEQLIAGDHRAIYEHPGNHPHSTLLTTLEACFDLYRATGRQIYIDAVKSALKMYEDKWQHVGGGISMCEYSHYYPGCNWLSPGHNYNELCSTNFWVLLNQRMRRMEPDNAHYADEMENSLYNVLLAAQVGTQGYHYLNLLERTKDWRYLDRATCCASLGTRLAGLLPQFLYTHADDTVYADIYSSSVARLPLMSGDAVLRQESDLPDGGRVRIRVESAAAPFTLKARVPRWAFGDVAIYKNGERVAVGAPSSYAAVANVAAGDEISFDIPSGFKVTRYSGAEELPGKERYAVERGPLLLAAMGAPNPLTVRWDASTPEEWLMPIGGGKYEIAGDGAHEYWPYLDIYDEPFSVYPIVEPPKE